MKNPKLKFSLIIPCFNESKNLPTLIERCNQNNLIDIEIILVNNGSTDDSDKVLDSLLIGISHIKKVKVEKNQGYGYGIIAGLREAKNEIIGWTHADLQTEPSDIINAIPLFDDTQYDRIFVKGLRKGRPLSDLFFTLGMSIFESIYLRYFFWDINAQPTLFHRDFLKEFKEPPLDFSLDLYVYFLAKKNKFGYLFSIIFLVLSLYYYFNSSFNLSLILIFLSSLFFLLALFLPRFLQPFNFLWMQFGIIIGKIISPIVLGIIFFLIFTPLSVIMKIVSNMYTQNITSMKTYILIMRVTN